MDWVVSLILKLALLAVVITGGWYDLRSRRIPNWLNISGLILGFGLNLFLLQGQGFKMAATGLGLALVIYLPLYLIRAMGAGDVKFMAAIGALIGPDKWLVVFLITAVLGGLASLCLVIVRNRFYVTLSNLSTITTELLHGRLPFEKDPSLDVRNDRALGLPHGTLIALSVCIFVLLLSR